MFFNSLDFAIFLPIVFILYWFIQYINFKVQNTLLLIASYFFYGWWDWRFLSLIIFSSLIDYFIGIQLSKSDDKTIRKLLLLTSVFVNIGFLGFFKYFNFFADNFTEAFTILGGSFEVVRLNVILPVGISFYTFQTLSYSIDVYKKKLEPTKDIIAFFAFVSFFPQLVAGPIERATNLLPQFYNKREFEYHKAVDGIRLILWGLFKKIVIADNCAVFANEIFNNYTDYSGSTLFIGALFFAFQIYGDFSGYSDIAIGTSRLFGFNLMRNFNFPYFSRDIAEFWRRWHISLSTWFRDYLYIPLGGSKVGSYKKIRNVFIIFIVSGFWHGANWTFIAWGTIHAFMYIPLLIANKNRNNIGHKKSNNLITKIREKLNIGFTFFLVTIAWIFFRSENITNSLEYIYKLFFGLFDRKNIIDSYNFLYWEVSLGIIFMILIFNIIEWYGKREENPLNTILHKLNLPFRWFIYYLIFFAILYFEGKDQEFIYFQF